MTLDERHPIPDVPSPPYIGFTERSTIQPSENSEEQEPNHFEVPPVLEKTLSSTSFRARGEGRGERRSHFVVGNGEQNDFTRFERVEEFESCGCDRGAPERT